MFNTRAEARRMEMPPATSNNIITSINAIRTLTFDPSLRQLLMELEYERLSIEERIHFTSGHLYNHILARMDLARNRRTHHELVGLAEVERMGWTNDSRRPLVDTACSEHAADGYRAGLPRIGGPSDTPTLTSLFTEPDWSPTEVIDCADLECQVCRPISPGTKRTVPESSAKRWSRRFGLPQCAKAA